MVELLSIWRSKLPSKHPELTPPLGNGHSLQGKRGGAENMPHGLRRQQELAKGQMLSGKVEKSHQQGGGANKRPE